MAQSGYSTSTALRGPMFLVFFPSLALVGGLGFAWNDYVTRFQAARCPSDTFMVHDQVPGLAVILELCFIIALTILLFSVLFPALIKGLSSHKALRGFRLDSRESSEVSGIRKVSGIAAALSAVSMVYAMPSHLMGAFDHLQRRPWADVSTVTTSCWNRKGWGAEMDLDLRDGKSLYLNSKISGDAAWSEYLPKVAKALHGHDFKFDASGVGPVCRVPKAAMLRIRP
jgi:hypothetical protein